MKPLLVSAGVIEPRSRSAALSAAHLDGAKKSSRREVGLIRVTESDPSYGALVDAPFPIATKTEPSPATTGPPGAQIPPSRLVGTTQAVPPARPLAFSEITAPLYWPQSPAKPPNAM